MRLQVVAEADGEIDPAPGHPSARPGGPAIRFESTYAHGVRLRTKRTKGCGTRTATLTMVWKLALEAEKTWRRLMGFKLDRGARMRRRRADGGSCLGKRDQGMTALATYPSRCPCPQHLISRCVITVATVPQS